jgi:hypothetical protein
MRGETNDPNRKPLDALAPRVSGIPSIEPRNNLGLYHEADFVDDAGQVMVRPRLVKDLTVFARQ